MATLKALFDQELPLNRKERYFTGTVFPMIVCCDNFKHFNLFLNLIGCKSLKIEAGASTSNIQFFSEYSFKESVTASSAKRFREVPDTKETPDIVILVKDKSGDKILILLEAKMFDKPSAVKMQKQLKAQQDTVIKTVTKALSIPASNVYHFALLPEPLYKSLKARGYKYNTVTWEQIYTAYSKVKSNDYFLGVLKLAIDQYRDLVSKGSTTGKNSDSVETGAQILKQKDLIKFVGRQGGLKGKAFKSDLDTGKWRTQDYEVSYGDKKPNHNWFTVAQFMEAVNPSQKTQPVLQEKVGVIGRPKKRGQKQIPMPDGSEHEQMLRRVCSRIERNILNSKLFIDQIPTKIWFGKSGKLFLKPNFQLEFNNGKRVAFQHFGGIFKQGEPFKTENLYAPLDYKDFKQKYSK